MVAMSDLMCTGRLPDCLYFVETSRHKASDMHQVGIPFIEGKLAHHRQYPRWSCCEDAFMPLYLQKCIGTDYSANAVKQHPNSKELDGRRPRTKGLPW